MDNKIQILLDNVDVEKLLTSFEMLSLSNVCNGQEQLDLLNGKSGLNFDDDNKELSGLCVLHSKNNLFLNLRQINISNCKLTEIPDTVFTLKYLTVLNLSNNFLESLPKELGNLHNLVTLKVRGNKLSNLPKSLKSAEQLNYLDLSCNKFSEVPDVLYYGLRVLKVLNLSCNLLTQFNDPPACLNKLIILGLSNNILNQLPLWIFDNLCQLQILDVSENQLGLGVELGSYCRSGIFSSLQLLNIENCNYTCGNVKVFSNFTYLKVLYCGNKVNLTGRVYGRNYFGNLELEAFKNFKEIKHLYLQNVEISTLPSDCNCFKNIELLDLSYNNLSWLPESFCSLTTLKVLKLASNQLLFLPDDIGNLVSLQEIHLPNNKLNQIPKSFYNLINLQFIDFYNNKIRTVNLDIFRNKNLKGIDLGLNLLQFDFTEFGTDVDEIGMLYNCLKDSFRKHFGLSGSRSDRQNINSDDRSSSDSHSSSRRYSSSSLESEKMLDLDGSCISVQQSYNEDENWDTGNSCAPEEEDEMFDPNELDKYQPMRTSWSSDFQNNYCPAKFHVPSLMKTYVKNFRLASQNDAAEGQFDSD